MSYSFDDGFINGAKPSVDSMFTLHFKKDYKYQKMSYYDALFYNARMMKDNYAEPFDVLLSGGIDSEIVVRILKQEGIRHNVYTIRFEDDHNIRDVNDAKKIADNVGIDLKIIDWNLKKFFESGDALALFEKSFSPVPGSMLRHAWFDLLDNIPVMGEGEPYWRRELRGDYTIKSAWKLHWEERDFSASIYANKVGRTVIGEWYNYTPEIVMNYHTLPLVKRLLNDELYGKESCWSSRRAIHLPLWPNIDERPKLGGYEGLNKLPGCFPEFMDRFQFKYTNRVSNVGYTYSIEELERIFQ